MKEHVKHPVTKDFHKRSHTIGHGAHPTPLPSSGTRSKAPSARNSLIPTAEHELAHTSTTRRRESSNGGGIRSQRERDLGRDIRLALRADEWRKIPDLLADWELVSNKDILVECGIQVLSKERGLCEKILDHVVRRGPLKSSEYAYASATIHLACCQYFLSKWDDCVANLSRGIKFIESYLDNASSTASTSAEWLDLKDWAIVFLAVMHFRRGQYHESLHVLDKTTNYQVVLSPGRFAFFTLVKAKSLFKLGFLEESIKALNRRQSQEEALGDINQASSHDNDDRDRPNVFSLDDLRKSLDPHEKDESIDGELAIQACHDLHIWLLHTAEREAEAKEMFAMFKNDGSKRAVTLKDFVRRVKEDDIGKAIINAWVANPNELMRRM
ncbi:hypothetical protein HDV05_003038 [Chytridiales sp. JEL 0842]|nr:hypothetical protein HDV05_003038 [Chytridiales sp. JEL 0842]